MVETVENKETGSIVGKLQNELDQKSFEEQLIIEANL